MLKNIGEIRKKVDEPMKKWVKKCETSRFHRPRAESIESAVIFDPCRVRPRLLGRKMPGFRASAAQDCVETHTKGAPAPPPPPHARSHVRVVRHDHDARMVRPDQRYTHPFARVDTTPARILISRVFFSYAT